MAILRRCSWRVALTLALASTVLIPTAPATATSAPAPAPPGGFTAVPPSRILDTRFGVGAPSGPIGPGQEIELQVTGQGGVPATGVAAVALNLAVTEPTALGYITLYPTGEARPLASNTNFVAGQTVSTAAVVKLGTGGRITVFNSSGNSHVIVDVNGWHAITRTTGSPYTPLTPVRLLDTRVGPPIGPGGKRTLAVTQGLPAGVTAVALNVTATEPTAPTYLTVYPAGGAPPLASNLNVVGGQTRGNFVAAKVAGGAVDIFNAAGSTHVVVDLLGFWAPSSNARIAGITPTRIMDTRLGLGAPLAPIGPGQTTILQLPGPSSVPVGAVAAVLNVTVTGPTAQSWLTVYPTGVDRPLASNLNFDPGETVPNLVIVPLSVNGQVSIYNSAGTTEVVVDVVGWLDVPSLMQVPVAGLSTFGSDVVIDPTSTYAYISNTANNQVEVLRLADGVFEDPIFVGSQPMGLDLNPAGDRLYVADRGSAFVSVVDVPGRTELHRFAIPSGFSSARPYSIAVLANGKALLTTTFDGSGFGANMYSIDLATETVTLRTDFWFGGSTTEFTSLRASGDRTAAVITAGDISSGPVFRYSAATDTFSNEVDTNSFTAAIATNQDGTVSLLNGGRVFDANLNLAGTVPGCGAFGVAVNAAGTVGYGIATTGGYGSNTGAIAVCDLVRFQITGLHIISAAAVGRMAISPNGGYVVGLTDLGVVILRP